MDVNVHPTKRQVHFLNEELITERIADAVQVCLAKGNASRRFEYQVCFCCLLLVAVEVWAHEVFFFFFDM